ncbi:MAG TPA: preprotein translocase subunit YajC [Bacteroidales bacterium]|nr:preprotein translocase subunit YajC [Bacteroidales bacterium]HPT01128.1 preprotein translocase subunit YajC [Bacteroidales bacterium]
MEQLTMLLMAPAGGAQKGGSGLSSLIFLLVIFVVFYLFFIRPQVKRTKEQKKYRENLQKGQKIITIGGIHGRIVEMQDTTVTIEVEGGTRLRIEKSAVAADAQDQLGTEAK